MKVRFSVVAFVPPNAQLGVVGSAPFLGEWDVKKCLPLLPYSSPHPAGQEPSLWFRDVDIPAAAGWAAAVAAVNRAAGDAADAACDAAVAGVVGGAASLNRDECEGRCRYVMNGSRSMGDASSSCSQCLNSSNNGLFYTTSTGSEWLNKSYCCCRTCFNDSSGHRVDNCSGRYFTGGGCPGCADSTRCTTSRSGGPTANSGCVRDSSRGVEARGLNSGCEGPPAGAAVCDIAGASPFASRCALHHTAAFISHTAGLPGGATAARTVYDPVFCPPCRDEDASCDSEFAWQLLLAASRAQPSGSRAAVAAADEASSSSSSCCCCHKEDANGVNTLPTAAAGCRDHWKHNGIQLRQQQLQRLERLQDDTDSKCEPASLYYSAAPLEHQQRQTQSMQAPLRRCCRRRDQALSSVEGRVCSGATAPEGERFSRGFVDSAEAAGQPSDRDFIDAAPTVEPSPCAHTCFHRQQRERRSESAAAGDRETCECNSVWGAAAYSIDPRIPAVLQLLETHPLKLLQFEYKFILWYPPSEKAAVPCFPRDAGAEGARTEPVEAYLYGSGTCGAPVEKHRGNGMRVGAVADTAEEKPRERPTRSVGEVGGEWTARTMQRGWKAECCRLRRHHYRSPGKGENWREWLFPPLPARLPSPPEAKEMLVWEGTGPAQNRRFVFDPFDVVVDLNKRGELQCLYICKIAHFRDPRAGGTGEYELTTRFYNSVRSESRMHFSRICPGLYVGSCPRQLLHIRLLKEELKVTCIFNLQTEQDICNNYPDPMATARSAEDVSHLCDSQGLRYVWLPTVDMCDFARKTTCANAAFLLLGLIKSGHCVYVHCNAGVGRSIAAVSAFLCFAVGLDLRKVNFLICAKRPVAYWDEKAMKYGLGDYTCKYGKCAVLGDIFKEKNEETHFCCA